ncbi:ABC transporter ATP-binding protein [Agromyces sp. LHK192]|uniref:ABC transporter ATP-binding protein n=1 Tax=Agromyces sp. LHK192 TaxID=2498704 RepID=UPI000FD93FED|nr:ABC transporter ATP-binding protein [Agromyces sp. LHK192]
MTDVSTRTDAASAASSADAASPSGAVASASAAEASATPVGARLAADAVTLGYDRRVIAQDLSVEIPTGSFTVVIGPNACGKSTLLRALARVMAPAAGTIVLDGRSISSYPPKEVARRLGLLPQTSIAPEGITVADLVARGRHPHQGVFRQWTAADEQAVLDALDATNTTGLSGRLVEELSGGQRQRVWVAMVLAQQTPIMLLDEPTTFLDIAHQYELLELLRGLHAAGDRTLVAVLHDLNQAARYADHLIVMRDGEVVATGDPTEVLTADLVEDVFGLPCTIIPDPHTGTPLVVPRPVVE